MDEHFDGQIGDEIFSILGAYPYLHRLLIEGLVEIECIILSFLRRCRHLRHGLLHRHLRRWPLHGQEGILHSYVVELVIYGGPAR